MTLAPDCEEKATKIEEFLVLCGGKTFGNSGACTINLSTVVAYDFFVIS